MISPQMETPGIQTSPRGNSFVEVPPLPILSRRSAARSRHIAPGDTYNILSHDVRANESRFSCYVCGEYFDSRLNLNGHKQVAHQFVKCGQPQCLNVFPSCSSSLLPSRACHTHLMRSVQVYDPSSNSRIGIILNSSPRTVFSRGRQILPNLRLITDNGFNKLSNRCSRDPEVSAMDMRSGL